MEEGKIQSKTYFLVFLPDCWLLMFVDNFFHHLWHGKNKNKRKGVASLDIILKYYSWDCRLINLVICQWCIKWTTTPHSKIYSRKNFTIVRKSTEKNREKFLHMPNMLFLLRFLHIYNPQNIPVPYPLASSAWVLQQSWSHPNLWMASLGQLTWE